MQKQWYPMVSFSLLFSLGYVFGQLANQAIYSQDTFENIEVERKAEESPDIFWIRKNITRDCSNFCSKKNGREVDSTNQPHICRCRCNEGLTFIGEFQLCESDSVIQGGL